jgi:transcriptional regulator with XRE-family HTH domain
VDMNIDREKVKALRGQRAWSQEQLAAASGLSLRTIQRIEKTGVAANDSVQALAAVLAVDVKQLLQRPDSRRWLTPLRAAAGFAGGSVVGLALTLGSSASAVDYTVQSFLNHQPVAVRMESKGDLRAVTVSLKDSQSYEQARVRILTSELENGNVRFDLVLYDCDERGCSQVSTPAMETVYGKPARVEWTTGAGKVIAYEFTPSK